jgi:hypothetical protein
MPQSHAVVATVDDDYRVRECGASMKIGYDLLLWRAFRHLKPPEEARTLR